jgi:hypothetical protein
MSNLQLKPPIERTGATAKYLVESVGKQTTRKHFCTLHLLSSHPLVTNSLTVRTRALFLRYRDLDDLRRRRRRFHGSSSPVQLNVN